MRDDRSMMADRTTDRSPASDRRLDELAFLHEIAQLATLARDWDELMRSIVDGTTVAMGVEVCSFYLADHEKTRLTLAATNGLDRTQVGTGQPRLGRGDHRTRGRDRDPDRGRGRHGRRALRMGPRLRHRRPGRDAVGAARVARHGGRGAQRPDPGKTAVRRRARSRCSGRSPRCSPGSSRRAA